MNNSVTWSTAPQAAPRARSAGRPSVSPASRVPPPSPWPSAPMAFQVQLDIFRGPLDLLFYLVRKQELDVVHISIASITEQFLEHLCVLEELDVNSVGDFLEMASWLIEIKSRSLLPHCEDEAEDPFPDPRELLVEQLLQYKQFKDAASILEERGRRWSEHYTRQANDLPMREVDPADQPIEEIELWDLVSALGRVMRANQLSRPTSIVYDETPIRVYMQQIHERLREEGQIAFSDMFRAGMHKSAMIGVFLAILELVRHHSVVTDQPNLHGEIWVHPGEEFEADFDGDSVESEFEPADAGASPIPADDASELASPDPKPTADPRHKPR